MDFFVSGANLVPGALGKPQAKVQNLMAIIKFGRHTFEGNDRRRYVSVRHLNPGANLCVKGLAVLWTFL